MLYLISLFLLIVDFIIFLAFDLRYLLGYLVEKKGKKYIERSREVKISSTIPIIVPIKNEPKVLVKRFLFNFLQSLKSCDYKKFVLIFVDDSDEKRKKEYLDFFTKLYPKYSKQSIDNLDIYIFSNYLLYIHRKYGIRRKGAAIQDVLSKILDNTIEFFATYDIEWTINLCWIYKGAKILKKYSNIAFVTGNRITIPWNMLHQGINLPVDYFFEILLTGKQHFNEAIMYHGSCTVLKYKAVEEVGGFTPHLTEDADLTIRLYLHGYKGIHLKDWKEYGQNLPGNLNMALRTYTRWIYGTQNIILKYLSKILKSKNLKMRDKISFIHIFTHFFTFLFILLFLIIGYLYTFFIKYPSVPSYINNIFIFLPIIMLISQIMILIYIQKRIYNSFNPLSVLMSLMFSWGLSVIAIYSFFKNLFKIKENWIVTVKIKKPHRIYTDINTLYLLFFIISLFYFIENLPSIAFTTFTVWLTSLLFYIIYQILHTYKI